MNGIAALAFGTLLVLGTARASAQSYGETEPNDDKGSADAVPTCLAAGDTISGTTTGGGTTGGGATSRDYYRVKTCPGTPAIADNRLTITTAVTGHTGSIRGLTQAAGAPLPGTDALMQVTSTVTVPPRFVQWYAFGLSEEIYFGVSGTAATTASYVATLSQAAVVPSAIPAALLPGTITLSSVGQTGTDTEIYVYDSAYQPVPTFHNDDEGPGGATAQSRVARILAAGFYYVAISNYNTANDQGDANVDEDWLTGNLLDFPDALANSSTTTSLSLDFTISDGVTTIPVSATKSAPYQLVWFTFTVGTPPTFETYCVGDGQQLDHTTACPCANYGSIGNGCANSVNANGANLTASGVALWDNVVLMGSGMPATVSCIYLQGDALDDVVFGDGTRCTGGTLIRLRTRMNVGGASAFPDSTDTITLSARGGVVPGSGARRYYQTYYRNSAPAFCPPATFNVTNGWIVDW